MNTTIEDITKIENGTIVTPLGFKAAGIHSGVKRKRNDLGAIYCEIPASSAAVYTLNVIQAAPLKVMQESIAKTGKLQSVIVNSGNANACTGEKGMKDAYEMRDLAASQFDLDESLVAVASTGVIGEQMPMGKISSHIPFLHLSSTKDAADAFNQSILTTDKVRKSTCYEAQIDGKKVTMAGSAKGSGMIEPNMATMLAFITTDINIAPDMLEVALKEVTNDTFNCITVDGDTSTNDLALVLASGLAKNESLTPAHPDWQLFISLLRQTSEDLAKMIARDGEGATKLIEVEVHGARTNKEAKQVAKSIVGSSLVKTAMCGADANWGRVIAAIGYSGATVHADTIDLSIGPVELLANSQPVEFSEEEASAYLANDEVKMNVDLHVGDGEGKGWGCDLTYDYVRINASYRT